MDKDCVQRDMKRKKCFFFNLQSTIILRNMTSRLVIVPDRVGKVLRGGAEEQKAKSKNQI